MLEAKKGHLFSPKDMAILIFPLVIEQLLSITIGMADTIMVSSYSESAVSAVSSVDVISYLFINYLQHSQLVVRLLYLNTLEEETEKRQKPLQRI